MKALRLVVTAVVVLALSWTGMVLYGAGREMLRKYRASVTEQNMHYRGWMR